MEEYVLLQQDNEMYTVILGKEKRPPSPEPASSPCPGLHHVTPLGAREGWQGRPQTEAVVRSVHNCTSLSAAVIVGNTEQVKLIFEEKLSDQNDDEANSVVLEKLFNSYDCSGSPPICEAAYHHRLDIMKLLLQYGGHVDTVNHLGLTPTHITAANYMDNPDMMQLLIDCNADINRRSKDGRSPLHIAAETGHFKIVDALLSCGKLRRETIVETFRDGDVFLPPPIILAAVNHHYKAVNMLRKHTSYPVTLNSDVGLVFWSLSVFSDLTKGIPLTMATFEKLQKAIQFRDDDTRSPPISDYDNVIEVRTTDDVKELATKDTSIVIYHCLTIIEHALGLSNKLLGNYIEKAINILCQLGKYDKVQSLLVRIFRGMPLTEQQLMASNVYMMPSHLHITLSFFMVKSFWDITRKLTIAGNSIKYVPILMEYMRILDTILELRDRQSCQAIDHWGESFQNTFAHLLAIFSCALNSSAQRNASSTDRRALTSLGFDLIEKYNGYAMEHFTSLLHFALRKTSSIVEIIKFSGIGGQRAVSSYIQLIESLLIWGCNDAVIINAPYSHFFCKGERPLHMAVRLAEMDPCYLPIVNFLFIHGAHYDGVSQAGTVPANIATRPSLIACFDLVPLPLACLASKAVVSYQIDYLSNNLLPSVIKRYISYHDDYNK